MNEQTKLIQAEFDIPKFVEQRRLLDDTKFSKAERNGVGRLLLKSILIRIGSMRECVESQSTLASVFGVQRETINSAISRLTALDIITKERLWNERYGRVLNHYRVNWTELARRLDKSIAQIQPSNVSIHRDQCEDSPGTNVRIHRDRNRRTNEIETTTTEAEWKPVVVSLKAIGVKRIPEAIARAKNRGDSPEDALRIIERTLSDPKHAGKDMRGIVYNQVCSPSKDKTRKPSGAKPNREVIWERVYRAMIQSGISRHEINREQLETKTNQIYNDAMERWSGRRSEPLAEATR